MYNPEATAQVKNAYQQALIARQMAHAPYSKFQVGAALVAGKKIFSGCNVENASYGATICAERVALVKAVSEGVTQFEDVVVVTDLEKPAHPCGLCLQVLCEFCLPDTRVWMANTVKIIEMLKLSELYPRSFGPQQLRK